jgi:hypothetical protein
MRTFGCRALEALRRKGLGNGMDNAMVSTSSYAE